MKLCMFDFDGTLADTLVTIAYYVNVTLKDYGYGEIPVDDIKSMIGKGSIVLIQKALAWHGANPDEYAVIHKDYRERYDRDFTYLTAPYVGIVDMLREIKEIGIKIVVISNKDHKTTTGLAEKFFGSYLIDLCFGARKGVPLKPDPTVIYEVMDHFGADKEDCFYIGDTGTDIETAKNAGVYSIGVLWGFRDRDELVSAGADNIVAKPSEITSIIKGSV